MTTLTEYESHCLALLGAYGPHGYERELRALRRLPEAQQRQILMRLGSLHAYAELSTPSYHQAEHFAAQIGMRRANFLRLLERLSEHGPVDALARHRHVKRRASSARDGCSDAVEKVLASVLSRDPIATLGDVMAALNGNLPSAEVPHASTIRRRLSAVRQADVDEPFATAMVRRDAVFGRSVVKCCSPTDVVARPGVGSTFGRIATCYLGLVLDVETRLVIGAGLHPEPEKALAGAVRDVAAFLATMVVADLPVHPDLVRHLRSIIEEGSDERVIVSLSPPPSTRTEDAPVWRRYTDSGTRWLFRMVGDRLGEVGFVSEGAARSMPLRGGAWDMEVATEFVREEVDDWNYRLLCSRLGLRPEGGAGLVAKRMTDWSRARGSMDGSAADFLRGTYYEPGEVEASVHLP